MELVTGRTWRAELRRSGVIAAARASEWFRQLLEGLQFARAMGIVHRDLKPENVMIVDTPGGGDALKVMDFGLAKVLDAGTGVTESVTLAGTAMGTLGDMAPEILTGGLVDEQADIFAIGVMVVETLVGARTVWRSDSARDPDGVAAQRISPDWSVGRDSSWMPSCNAAWPRMLGIAMAHQRSWRRNWSPLWRVAEAYLLRAQRRHQQEDPREERNRDRDVQSFPLGLGLPAR